MNRARERTARAPLRRRTRVASVPLCFALLAIGLAVALPPLATARWLTGAAAPSGDVVAGLWAWKALLLIHGAILIVVALYAWNAAESATGLVPAGPVSRSRAEYGFLAVVLVVATALRAKALDAGLWFDEILTLVNYVREPFGRILTTFDSQNQHPLYSLLARLSVVAFGEGPATLRLPAAAFGVAGVGAVFWFARRVTTAREALLSAGLLACSYHHLWFSQNARGYTGLLFWTVLSTGLFLRMLQGGSPRGWGLPLGYAAAVALGAFTHTTGAIVAVAHLLVWGGVAVRSGGRVDPGALWRPAAAVALAGSITLLLYAPVLPQLSGTLVAPSLATAETDWQSPWWMIVETVRGMSRGVPGGLVGVAAGSLVVGFGLWSYARQRVEVALLFVVAPLLLAVLIIALRHNLWPRFFLFAAGFGVLLVMRGVAEIAQRLVPARRSVAVTTAGLVLLAGSAWTVPRAWGPKQDFVGAAAFVDGRATPADAVVTVDITDFPYRDYVRRDWVSVASADELREIEGRHGRTWVLYTFPTRLSAVYPDVWRRLDEEYAEAARFPGTVGGGAIVVMERQ